MEKSIEINISVFKYLCLAFFVHAMMYPTGQVKYSSAHWTGHMDMCQMDHNQII